MRKRNILDIDIIGRLDAISGRITDLHNFMVSVSNRVSALEAANRQETTDKLTQTISTLDKLAESARARNQERCRSCPTSPDKWCSIQCIGE